MSDADADGERNRQTRAPSYALLPRNPESTSNPRSVKASAVPRKIGVSTLSASDTRLPRSLGPTGLRARREDRRRGMAGRILRRSASSPDDLRPYPKRPLQNTHREVPSRPYRWSRKQVPGGIPESQPSPVRGPHSQNCRYKDGPHQQTGDTIARQARRTRSREAPGPPQGARVRPKGTRAAHG